MFCSRSVPGNDVPPALTAGALIDGALIDGTTVAVQTICSVGWFFPASPQWNAVLLTG
jgi:hypothetical protein